MSDLEYVVIYHSQGSTSVHPLSSWEFLRREFADETNRMIDIPDPYGGATLVWRKDIESIHLVTEEQVENNARRTAAINKVDREADPNWSE